MSRFTQVLDPTLPGEVAVADLSEQTGIQE